MPCSNCKFSAEAPKAGMVSCKRYPPAINPINPCIPPQSVFPTLAGNDACGEYQMVTMARMEDRDPQAGVRKLTVQRTIIDQTPTPKPKRGFFGRMGWLG